MSLARTNRRTTETGAKSYFPLEHVTELNILGERISLVAFEKVRIVGKKA